MSQKIHKTGQKYILRVKKYIRQVKNTYNGSKYTKQVKNTYNRSKNTYNRSKIYTMGQNTYSCILQYNYKYMRT